MTLPRLRSAVCHGYQRISLSAPWVAERRLGVNSKFGVPGTARASWACISCFARLVAASTTRGPERERSEEGTACAPFVRKEVAVVGCQWSEVEFPRPPANAHARKPSLVRQLSRHGAPCQNQFPRPRQSTLGHLSGGLCTAECVSTCHMRHKKERLPVFELDVAVVGTTRRKFVGICGRCPYSGSMFRVCKACSISEVLIHVRLPCRVNRAAS